MKTDRRLRRTTGRPTTAGPVSLSVVLFAATGLLIGGATRTEAQIVKPSKPAAKPASRSWKWPEFTWFKPDSDAKQAPLRITEPAPLRRATVKDNKPPNATKAPVFPWLFSSEERPIRTRTSSGGLSGLVSASAKPARSRPPLISAARTPAPGVHTTFPTALRSRLFDRPIVPASYAAGADCVACDSYPGHAGCLTSGGYCGFGCEDDSCYRPRPLGDAVWSHFHVHRIAGDAAQMVFYDYDFQPETAELNRYGRQRIQKVIGLLPQSFSPVLVEPVEGRPNLSESRRMAVVQMLAAGPFPVPAERVRLAWPDSPVLPGDEAQHLHQKHLQDIEMGGGLQPSYGGGVVLPADSSLDPTQ